MQNDLLKLSSAAWLPMPNYINLVSLRDTDDTIINQRYNQQ